MKILFLPVYIKTPHFETELELMLNHINSGDEVYVLKCNENLFTCEDNPNHLKSICHDCKSKFGKGISLIKNINVLHYPDLILNYSTLQNSFSDIEELKKYSFEGFPLGMGVASSLISRLNRDHEFDTIKYSKEIYVTLKTSYYILNIMKEVTISLKPDLVYVFNGRFATNLPMILYCERNNIPYCTHERGSKISKYCLFMNSIPHSLKNAYVEIEEMWKSEVINKEEIGASFFIERRNRVAQGWHSFTASQKENLLPKDLPEHKTIVSIFNSTVEEWTAVRGIENTFKIFRDEYDCLSTIFEYFKDDKDLQFYLRIHPNLVGSNNTQIKLLRGFISKYKNVEIIVPESPIDTYALMDNSDKIIVLGSTMGIEANYWGKPVIALRESFYQTLDSCYWPDTFDELVKMLKSDLLPKGKLGAFKYGFWASTRGTEFKHYKAETLFSGKFLNEYINMNNFQKVIYYFLKIIEVRNLKELLKALLRKLT